MTNDKNQEDVYDIEQEITSVDGVKKAISSENASHEEEKTWVKAIRTFETDIAEALEKGKGSLTGIVLAERKKKAQKKEKKEFFAKKEAIPKEVPQKPKENKPNKSHKPQTFLPKKKSSTFRFPLPSLKGSLHKTEDSETEKPKEVVPLTSKTEIRQAESNISTPESQLQASVTQKETLKAPQYKALEQKRASFFEKQIEHNLEKEKIQSADAKIGKIKALGRIEENKTTFRTFIKNSIIAFISIVFIGVGAGAMYGAYSLYKKPQAPETFVFSNTIIVTEEHARVKVPILTEDKIYRALEEELNLPLAEGKIKSIFFAREFFSSEEELEDPTRGALGIQELFTILPNDIPPLFLRALDNDDYLYGTYMKGVHTPFLILRVDDFSQAFSGMLKWEQDIVDDLSRLLVLGKETQDLPKIFEDRVIRNRDARVVRDGDREVRFLYSFIDQETIVITSNEKTFDEIVVRLKTPKKIIR